MTNVPRFRSAVMVLVACSACSTTAINAASQYSKKGVIGPGGGMLTVTVSDDATIAGTSIMVPPGALSAPVTIEIGATNKAVVSSGALGYAIDFEPSGTVFAKPVSITIPVTLPVGLDPARVAVKAVEADGTSRTIAPVAVTGNFANFQASGFTLFGGFVLPASDAGDNSDAGCTATCGGDASCGSSDGCGGTCNANCVDGGVDGGTTDAGLDGGSGPVTCDAVGDGGLFYPAVGYAAGTGPHALTTFQDHGGQIGLATANYGDGTVWVFTGLGDGTFIDGGSYYGGPSAPTLQTICSADFNGDGLADLAVDAWNNATEDMMLLTGTGGGAFSQANSNLAGNTTYEVITGDVNGDSLPDLLVIADAAIYIGLGQGDGGFAWGSPFTGLGQPRGLAIANFDRLATAGIAVADNNGDQVYVLEQSGGTFSAVGPYPVGQGPIAIAAADFNGDGCEDIVTGNNADDTITVLVGACATGVAPSATTYSLGTSPSQGGCELATCGRPQWLVTGDFNCDGNTDVAVAFYDPLATGENVALFLGNGDGTLQSPIYLAAGQGPSDIVTGDFNGDGKPDIAVSSWLSNDVSVFIHR